LQAHQWSIADGCLECLELHRLRSSGFSGCQYTEEQELSDRHCLEKLTGGR
jgi:hypothetical protein